MAFARNEDVMLLEQNTAVQVFWRGFESEKSEINRAALQLSDHPRMSRFADRYAHAGCGFSQVRQQRQQDRILSAPPRRPISPPSMPINCFEIASPRPTPGTPAERDALPR